MLFSIRNNLGITQVLDLSCKAVSFQLLFLVGQWGCRDAKLLSGALTCPGVYLSFGKHLDLQDGKTHKSCRASTLQRVWFCFIVRVSICLLYVVLYLVLSYS